MKAAGSGTSPRPWGKVVDVTARRYAIRNIPTPVGKSYRQQTDWCSVMEHPHARGEKRFLRGQKILRYGTSPRPWGKDPQKHSESVKARNIPTPVGKSIKNTIKKFFITEHPHARGEKRVVDHPMG